MPIVKPNIAPHRAFDALLGKATNSPWNSISNAHDRGLLLQPKHFGRPDVSAGRFIGKPIGLFPNDIFSDVVRKLVDIHFLAKRHLGDVFGTDQDSHVCLSNNADDRLTQDRMIVLFHLVITLPGLFVYGSLWIERRCDVPVTCACVERMSAITRDAAKELDMLQAVGRGEPVGSLVVSHICAKGGVRSETHDGTLNAVALCCLERDGFPEK